MKLQSKKGTIIFAVLQNKQLRNTGNSNLKSGTIAWARSVFVNIVGAFLNRHMSTLPAENKKPRLFYGYAMVALGFILLMVGYGSIGSYGVFFKPLLLEFGWTRAMTSGALSLNFLLQGTLSIFSGRLTDKLGPRKILTAAGLLLALSLFLMP